MFYIFRSWILAKFCVALIFVCVIFLPRHYKDNSVMIYVLRNAPDFVIFLYFSEFPSTGIRWPGKQWVIRYFDSVAHRHWLRLQILYSRRYWHWLQMFYSRRYWHCVQIFFSRRYWHWLQLFIFLRYQHWLSYSCKYWNSCRYWQRLQIFHFRI